MTPDETLPEDEPAEGDEAGADSETEPLPDDVVEGAELVVAADPDERLVER